MQGASDWYHRLIYLLVENKWTVFLKLVLDQKLRRCCRGENNRMSSPHGNGCCAAHEFQCPYISKN